MLNEDGEIKVMLSIPELAELEEHEEEIEKEKNTTRNECLSRERLVNAIYVVQEEDRYINFDSVLYYSRYCLNYFGLEWMN